MLEMKGNFSGAASAVELFTGRAVNTNKVSSVLVDFFRYRSKLVDMKLDNKQSHLSRLLKLGLIALAVYFSQVYPYVHFHHAHAETVAQVDLSLHPIDAEPYHSHHGHGHNHNQSHDDTPHESGDTHHHHQDFDQHVDWHLIRTYTASILSHIDFTFISVQFDTGPTQTSSPRFDRIASTPLPDSAFLDGINSRGPPAIA